MAMFARTRILDRLKILEARITPKGRAFTFFNLVDRDETDAPSYAERLEAFKIEHGIGPADTLHTVTYVFS
jgi:hypothetical protein